MAIETANEPLSGSEIKEIMMKRFRELLDKDCTLHDDLQYPGFDFKLTAMIRFHRSHTTSTLVWTDQHEGEQIDGGDPETETDNLADTYTTDSPAEARDDHNLPHTVYVPGPNGPEKQKIMIPDAVRRGPGRPRRS